MQKFNKDAWSTVLALSLLIVLVLISNASLALAEKECNVIMKTQHNQFFVPMSSANEWDLFSSAVKSIPDFTAEGCVPPLTSECGNRWTPFFKERKGRTNKDFLAQIPSTAREVLLASRTNTIYNKVHQDSKLPLIYDDGFPHQFARSQSFWYPVHKDARMPKVFSSVPGANFDTILGYRDADCGGVTHCGATWVPLKQPLRFTANPTNDLDLVATFPSSLPSDAIEVLLVPKDAATYEISVWGNRHNTGNHGAYLEISTKEGQDTFTKLMGSRLPVSLWMPVTPERKLYIHTLQFISYPWRYDIQSMEFEILGYRTAISCSRQCTERVVSAKMIETKPSSLTEQMATFTLPSSIPNDAVEILFNIGTYPLVYNDNVEYDRDPERVVVFTQDGPHKYAKKIYGTVEIPYYRNRYYTDPIELPITKERKIYIKAENAKIKKSMITIRGYRKSCQR